MRWAFWRKPKPVHIGSNSVDWRPGDIAECVQASWLYVYAPKQPQVGTRAMVADVVYGNVYGQPRYTMFGLSLIGFEGQWQADFFRKIVLPETEADRKVGRREPTHCREDA
jgi:hypothetical protein